MLSAVTAADAVLVVVGVVAIWLVVDAAVRTFILPRGAPVALTRIVFRGSRAVFELLVRPARSYEARDRVMALYAPTTLVVLPSVWLVVAFAGFACVFYAIENDGWSDAFAESGSSLLTLGFREPSAGTATWLSFVAATIGLAILALLIAYLPQIYSAFSRRELLVSKLAVRADTPPDGVGLLQRAHLAGYLRNLDSTWEEWETWFAELAETHTSLAVLTFFRSPSPERSWITASGAVLDAAALRYAVLNVPWSPAAGLCIRSGYLALREIAGYFGISYDPDPKPDDPITIAREEFDEAFERLARVGAPVRDDREAAWRDFAGWRVNYDQPLLALCALTAAPYAPWSSDRSPRLRRRPLRGH